MSREKVRGAAVGLCVVVTMLLCMIPDLGPWWGSAVGVVGGTIGGAVGVCVAIKRTELPQERTLLVRYFTLFFLLMGGCLACFLLLPLPGYYRFLVFLPFGIGLFLLVRSGNRRRREIYAQVLGAGPGTGDPPSREG
jgi:hypothetical protein